MSHCDIGRFARGVTAGMWVFVAVCAAALAGGVQGAVIAAWNMNGVSPLQGTVVSASSGSGTLDFGGLGATASVLQGTTLGAQKGELAGDALAAVGTLANGTSFRLDFETFGYGELTVSFATRRSATGASINRLEYWSGFAWVTAMQFPSNPSTWELVSFKFPPGSELEDNYASLRFVVDGATSGSGSLRFDNIAISGTAMPAPGAIALLGLAGCVSRRRR